MRRLLPGMAALGALFITAPAQASFAPEGSPLAVGAAQPYGVLTADFNRDGRTDAATVNGTGSNLSVFLRGPAGFAAEAGSPFPTGPGPGYGVVADFNGDGFPDVATQNFNNGTVERPAPPAGRRLRRRADIERRRGHRLGHRRGLQRRRSARHRRTELHELQHPHLHQQRHRFHAGGDQPHRHHAPRRRGRRLQRRRAAGPGHLQPRRRLGHRPPAQRRPTPASRRRRRPSRSAPRPRASRRPTSTATVGPTSPWP